MRKAANEVVFGYGRVSTDEQHTGNQRQELQAAGWRIACWHDEVVSGAVTAAKRPGWRQLMADIDAHLRSGQKVALVVAKLDRLGRDASDVLATVRDLDARGVKVFVHQLGRTDLTSAAGRMLMTMLAAVAEFERDLLRERTRAGLARTRANGTRLGRPPKTTDRQRREVRKLLAAGESISQVARDYGVSRSTVIAIRDAG